MWVKQPRPTPSAFLSLLIRGAYSSEMNYTWSFWWYHWPLTPTITVVYMKPIVALMGLLTELTKKHPALASAPNHFQPSYSYTGTTSNEIMSLEVMKGIFKKTCQCRHASCRTAWWKTIPWWNRRTSSVLGRHGFDGVIWVGKLQFPNTPMYGIYLPTFHYLFNGKCR